MIEKSKKTQKKTFKNLENISFYGTKLIDLSLSELCILKDKILDIPMSDLFDMMSDEFKKLPITGVLEVIENRINILAKKTLKKAEIKDIALEQTIFKNIKVGETFIYNLKNYEKIKSDIALNIDSESPGRANHLYVKIHKYANCFLRKFLK